MVHFCHQCHNTKKKCSNICWLVNSLNFIWLIWHYINCIFGKHICSWHLINSAPISVYMRVRQTSGWSFLPRFVFHVLVQTQLLHSSKSSSSILFSCTGTTLDLTPTIDTSQTIMFSHKQEATATVTASSVTPTTEAGPTKGTSTNCQLKTFYSFILCLWILGEVDKWRFIVKKFN